LFNLRDHSFTIAKRYIISEKRINISF